MWFGVIFKNKTVFLFLFFTLLTIKSTVMLYKINRLCLCLLINSNYQMKLSNKNYKIILANDIFYGFRVYCRDLIWKDGGGSLCFGYR